jgi:hypothetical protein
MVTAVTGTLGVGMLAVSPAAALAGGKPPGAHQPVSPASRHQKHPTPAPVPVSDPAAPAPLSMDRVVAALVDVFNKHPEAFAPLLDVPARQLFGSFGYVSAVNQKKRTLSVVEQVGYPRPHGKVTVEVAAPVLLIDNAPATLTGVRVYDRVGVAGSRHGSRYTALTIFVHRPGSTSG